MSADSTAVSNPARRVAVLGAGAWGTTFAKVLADGGSHTVLWARRPEIVDEIRTTGRNNRYVPGVELEGVTATTSLSEALDEAEQIYLAIPSQSLRAGIRQFIETGLNLRDDAIIVSLMKGVEQGSRHRMSEVIQQELSLDPARFAVVSGPNLALEIAREQPTAAVVASTRLETARAVAKAAATRYFRSYVSTDVIGTELGGVLKNLIAIAVGIVDGVGYGENTKASIITRGLVEISDFAVAFGARPKTMMGLAGLGDLIATCQSPLSRNNTAGRLLGQGYSFADVVRRMDQTAEGLASVAPILELARARGVGMPIVEQVSQVLAGTLDPKDIAPHLTTDSDEPQGERTTDDIQARRRGALWGALKRTLDQLRDRGGNPRRD